MRHRIRALVLSFSLIALAGVVPASSHAATSPAAKQIAAAQSFETSLKDDVARLRKRHNLEKLIAMWTDAEKRASGSEQRTAAEGLLRARKLLAHWSGLPADRQAATDAERKLAARAVDRKATNAARGGGREDANATRGADRQNVVDRNGSQPTAAAGKRVWISAAKLDQGALILDVDGEAQVEKSTIPPGKDHGARIFFDLSPAVAAREALKSHDINADGVSRIRVGQFDADTVRLVVDLTADADANAVANALVINSTAEQFALKTTAEAMEPSAVLAEIVEDMKRSEAIVELFEPSPPAAEEEAPKMKLAESAPIVDVPPARDLKRSTREAARPREAGLLKIRRVVIDAGHGGKDFGAIGVGGVREKDVNLQIALKLGEELKKRLGVKVIYTRAGDEFVSLRKRSQIANNANGDLFISVHANAHKKRSIAGIETYYLNTTSDRYATRLALRENTGTEGDDNGADIEPTVGNAEEHDGELPSGELGQDLRLVLADLAMRSASSESRRLAGYVQSTLVSSLKKRHDDVKDLGVKHALFYVLLGVRMPSVLIESGFVTHATEGKRLASARYQDDVAHAIANGIVRFAQERDAIAKQVGDGDDERQPIAAVRK